MGRACGTHWILYYGVNGLHRKYRGNGERDVIMQSRWGKFIEKVYRESRWGKSINNTKRKANGKNNKNGRWGKSINNTIRKASGERYHRFKNQSHTFTYTIPSFLYKGFGTV